MSDSNKCYLMLQETATDNYKSEPFDDWWDDACAHYGYYRALGKYFQSDKEYDWDNLNCSGKTKTGHTTGLWMHYKPSENAGFYLYLQINDCWNLHVRCHSLQEPKCIVNQNIRDILFSNIHNCASSSEFPELSVEPWGSEGGRTAGCAKIIFNDSAIVCEDKVTYLVLDQNRKINMNATKDRLEVAKKLVDASCRKV